MKPAHYIIRFPDAQTEDRAIKFLIGRFTFKTWASGEMMITEDVIPALASQHIKYIVEGLAQYEHLLPPVSHPSPVAIQ